MNSRDRLNAALARQLGRPSGLVGRFILSMEMLKTARERFAAEVERGELRLDAELALVDHRRVGEGRVPAHLLIATAG